uniref:Uncharacterized protein n=1 Tax=Timema genevievae TaxID=629358 RepID=A0A7R9K3E7_TIMGE|nr:unnamed protein product [Timema genevievae]
MPLTEDSEAPDCAQSELCQCSLVATSPGKNPLPHRWGRGWGITTSFKVVIYSCLDLSCRATKLALVALSVMYTTFNGSDDLSFRVTLSGMYPTFNGSDYFCFRWRCPSRIHRAVVAIVIQDRVVVAGTLPIIS